MSHNRLDYKLQSQSLGLRRIAQMVECPLYTGKVAGSNPAPPTICTQAANEGGLHEN